MPETEECRTAALDAIALLEKFFKIGLCIDPRAVPSVAIAQVLTYVRRQPYFAVFKASLPVAGVDGTLRHRLTGTPAQGRLFAKTGSMAHVSSLSGYAAAANGETNITIRLIELAL